MIERSPGNLGSALNRPGAQAPAFPAWAPESATGVHDPGVDSGWTGVTSAAAAPPGMTGVGGRATEPGHQGACRTTGVDTGTDSDAVSPFGEPIAPGDPEMRGIPEGRRAARAFWASERAKSRRRKCAGYEPTPRVRRVAKRKGKGKR